MRTPLSRPVRIDRRIDPAPLLDPECVRLGFVLARLQSRRSPRLWTARKRRPSQGEVGMEMWAMKKLLWICPRCGGKNRLRFWICRRCRAKVVLQRRLDLALLWAGALR